MNEFILVDGEIINISSIHVVRKIEPNDHCEEGMQTRFIINDCDEWIFSTMPMSEWLGFLSPINRV